MSLGIIDNYDFGEMEAMKYYSPVASWSAEKKIDNVKGKIFGQQWLGAQKMDGYFACFIKDDEGNMILKSRSRNVNGEFVNKIEWVPHLQSFFDTIPNGTCFIGELYLPSKPGSKNITSLLGCLKEKCIARQEQGEKLHFYIFDCLAMSGTSWLDKIASFRFNSLLAYSKVFTSEYVEWAQYVSGEELWDTLQSILASGGEGMVITSPNGLYEPGKRPSKTTLKVKQELKQTIDCIIIGCNPPTKEYAGIDLQNWTYWVDGGTDARLPVGLHALEQINGDYIIPVTKGYYNGWAGSLKLGLYKDGKIEYFGDLSGLTDDMKANWKELLGKVVEVGGMSIDAESGHIRHPRMMGLRLDKAPQECLWEQVQ